MDTKNYILQQSIYTPSIYKQLLSIIIVLKNVNKPLECLQNVLEQVYQPFEIILINNSTDATFNILSNYVLEKNITNVHLYSSIAKNMYECLNEGLEKAKGNYLAFQINDDRSSHLRFIYQIHELVTHKMNAPEISLCQSYNSNRTFISLKSMCFTRSVFNTIGYFLADYKEMCFDEYLWRYLIRIGVITNNEDKNMEWIEQNESTVRIVNKSLLFQSHQEHSPNREKLITQYNKFHHTHKGFVKFRNCEPIIEKSYLNNIYQVLAGNTIEHRVTLVYFATKQNDTLLKNFYKLFHCSNLQLIICYDSNVDLDMLRKFNKNTRLHSVESYANGFDLMFTLNISTPYIFVLQDSYEFNETSMLHPLSYLLDVMDKYVGELNSLRFGSVQNKGVLMNCQHPQIVYTPTFTNEPCILRKRHAEMFYKPYVDVNGRGELGVSDKLSAKYANEHIAYKLKMGIYGGLGYPATSKNTLKK